MLYAQMFFLFKQKTAYEMRISDWSSDVCSSDLFTPDALGYQGVNLAILNQLPGQGQGFGSNGKLVKAGRKSGKLGRASCKGKSVSVSVVLGGRRLIKKKKSWKLT